MTDTPSDPAANQDPAAEHKPADELAQEVPGSKIGISRTSEVRMNPLDQRLERRHERKKDIDGPELGL